MTYYTYFKHMGVAFHVSSKAVGDMKVLGVVEDKTGQTVEGDMVRVYSTEDNYMPLEVGMAVVGMVGKTACGMMVVVQDSCNCVHRGKVVEGNTLGMWGMNKVGNCSRMNTSAVGKLNADKGSKYPGGRNLLAVRPDLSNM